MNKKVKIILAIIVVVILGLSALYINKYVNNLLNNNDNTEGNTTTENNDNKDNKMTPPNGNMPPMGGNTNSNITYTSPNKIEEDSTLKNKEYTSDNSDEVALMVDGEIEVTLNKSNITKTGDSSNGDKTSFYGINSAILAINKANLTIKDSIVTTNSKGSNGVFSYGGSATTNNSNNDGTTINIFDSTITTSKDNSGGIMATGGGIINASNLKITTEGTSSATIRSDRGGGKIYVDGGTYTTNGNGSPSIYSTADINVKNADLISNASEGIIIEGSNSVSIDNVNLTDTNNKLNGLSTSYKNIFLYQSMSGDAKEGESTFTANESKITTNKGDVFYVTNTTSTINLFKNNFINNDTEGYFLRIKKDSWGNKDQNGGNVTLNLNTQNILGNIYVDELSTLSINMSSSYIEGYINNENTAKSIDIKLDKQSKLKLTKDSYITSLTNEDESNSNIDFGNYKLYVNGKSIN